MTPTRRTSRSAADPVLELLKRHLLPIALGVAVAVQVIVPVVVERLSDTPTPQSVSVIPVMDMVEQQDDLALIPCHLTDQPDVVLQPCSFYSDPSPTSPSPTATVTPSASMAPGPTSVVERFARLIPLIAAKFAESVGVDAYTPPVESPEPLSEPLASIN